MSWRADPQDKLVQVPWNPRPLMDMDKFLTTVAVVKAEVKKCSLDLQHGMAVRYLGIL